MNLSIRLEGGGNFIDITPVIERKCVISNNI